jgi:hypothetical protein
LFLGQGVGLVTAAAAGIPALTFGAGVGASPWTVMTEVIRAAVAARGRLAVVLPGGAGRAMEAGAALVLCWN